MVVAALVIGVVVIRSCHCDGDGDGSSDGIKYLYDKDKDKENFIISKEKLQCDLKNHSAKITT